MHAISTVLSVLQYAQTTIRIAAAYITNEHAVKVLHDLDTILGDASAALMSHHTDASKAAVAPPSPA